MPILGSVVGGVVGTISGKILFGLSGIAIPKVLEVYEKQKQAHIRDMQSVSQLMVKLSPDNELLQGVMMLARDDEQILTKSQSALVSFFEQLMRDYSTVTVNQCEVATELTENIFSSSDSSEYFILTPVPDENSPETFTSAVDLLVLRWPVGKPQPWTIDEEHVLDISEPNTRDE